MEETKKLIQDFISQGNTEKALELLETLTSDAVLLQSRFNSTKKQYGMGMLEYGEWSRTQAQINYAIIEMMNGVKGGASGTGSSPKTQPSTAASPGEQKQEADAGKKSKVFISYNTKDAFIMRSVKEYLEKNGIEVFVDINEIVVGDNIEQRIKAGLKKCKVIVSLISENSLRSGWVNTELSTALVLRDYGKKWLPLLLDKKHMDPTFYNTVMDEFDVSIEQLNKEIATAATKGRPVDAFADQQKRSMMLRGDFGETIRALGSTKGQDISNSEFFEDAMRRVVEAIKR